MNNKDIKFLIMDVDGTLTDGRIYMGAAGELCKAFDVKDGAGICGILPEFGIVPVILTGRQSQIVLNRCAELGIDRVYQNCGDKLEKMDEMLAEQSKWDGAAYTAANCAYIGDDILDLPCMREIKAAGGVVGCPHDAVASVQRIADYVSTKDGGRGAVREFIEWLTHTHI